MDGVLKLIGKLLGIGTLVGVMVVGLAFLFAFPTMWLWNWLMPAIFGLPKIGVLQALGLLVLFGLLFGRGSSSSSK